MTFDILQIPDETHAPYFSKLKAMKDFHPQSDAPTKAALVMAYYDAANMRAPFHTQEFYNLVPPALSFLNAKDQLLDVGLLEEYPSGGKPPKMTQSSTTVHPETLAQIVYIPALTQALQDGKDIRKIAYINQMPCPRCMGSLALGGVSMLVLDAHSFSNEWMHRRGAEYAMMSLEIAEKAGLRIVKYDIDTGRLDEWVKGLAQVAMPNGFEDNVDIAAGDRPLDVLARHTQTMPMLNPYTHYAAGALDTATGRFYIGEPTLTPGISHTDYASRKHADTKYSHVVPPVTALLIRLQARGVNPAALEIYTGATPSMRDIINALGAGVNHIHVPVPPALFEQMGRAPVYKSIEHNSTHPEAGNGPKTYRIYPQASALALLREKLDGRLIVEVNEKAYGPALMAGSSQGGGNTLCEYQAHPGF